MFAKALLLIAAAALLLGGNAAAAERASLPDVEDEVMCPTCGVVLAHAFSPQADRERAFIRAEIARGKTKQQIKDELVAEFGSNVLAVPRKKGFELAAYVVPIVVVLLAAIAVVLGLVRWRRRPAEQAAAGPAIAASDASRLEQDLSRYDP